MIYLRYFEVGGRVRKAISVIKNRLAAHESSIREFGITPQGIEIGEPLKQFEGILSGIPKFWVTRRKLLNDASDSGEAASRASP